jgi:RNA polymerase sigma-70 factor (ECF subfamily)
MRPSLPPDQLAVLLRTADRAARRLCRRLALPHHDIDDLRQELLLDLIARFSAFDPDRGSLEAFTHVVAKNRASRITVRVHRDRRLCGPHPVSLDAPVAGDDGIVFGDLIANDQSLGALFSDTVGLEHQVLAATSLDAALARLEPESQHLCIALIKSTVDQLAGSGHGARATLYRRLKEIRLALLAYGVEPA